MLREVFLFLIIECGARCVACVLSAVRGFIVFERGAMFVLFLNAARGVW